MIVEMRRGDSSQEMDDVVQRAKSLGLGVQLNLGTDKTVVAVLGSNTGGNCLPMFSPSSRACRG